MIYGKQSQKPAMDISFEIGCGDERKLYNY